MHLHNRMIKATFWNDTDLLQWPRDKRWFYEGLIQLADDSGCLEDSPFVFKLILFPSPVDADITVDVLANWRDEMIEDGKLIRYTVGKKDFLYVANFRKHQSIKNPEKPSVPLPPWIRWESYESNGRAGKYVFSDDVLTDFLRRSDTNSSAFLQASDKVLLTELELQENYNNICKSESGYKSLDRHLEPVSGTSQSSSVNCKDENQKVDISNPGGIEGTKMSEDGKESSAAGFQKSEDPELGKLARMYEEEGFGTITETVRETLVQMYDEFGATWVAEAMREAVLQNKRRLKYVVGILENWRREGGMRRSDGSKGAATDAKAPRRSRADPGPIGRYIPDGPPEDPELDEFLRKAGFYDIPGINC